MHPVARESPVDFSLLGGPLCGLGRRLGLVRGGSNTVLLGLTLGVGQWLVLVMLAAIEGNAHSLFTLRLIAGHARLLLVIPLFFLCESWINPRMTAFVRKIVQTGIVPPSAMPALDAEVARISRWKDAWWPEAVCLLAAVLMAVTGSTLQSLGDSGVYDPKRATLDAIVYFKVSLTILRFLLFRWAWKLALWGWFLWRVSRLDLHLLPGHPDRDGGLGSLEGVHERFSPLVVAISVLQCSAMAEGFSLGTFAVSDAYDLIVLVLLMDAALFLGPLLVFTDKLWASRTYGMSGYSSLAARYVAEFEAKWTSGRSPEDAPLLGTADLQSLADLGNSFSVVRAMRWVTVGPRLLTTMTVAALVPFAPLTLFKYPLAELAQKLIKHIVGL